MAILGNLFSLIKIGSLQLKNRLVMSPMALNYSGEGGHVTQRQVDYYTARARGGVGLIVTESFYVLPEGRANPKRQGLYDDRMVDEHKKLAAAVHQYGTPIFAQLSHAGLRAPVHAIGRFPVGPSAIPFAAPGDGVIPHQLTVDEIQEVVGAFGKAAARTKAAGYDGIQIHGGHGYLINEFLSPHYNRRDDHYGGGREGRIRLLMEILKRVRGVVGAGFPISVRITAREITASDGYSLDFTHWLVQQMEPWIDEVCISGGTQDDQQWIVAPMYENLARREGVRVQTGVRVTPEIIRKLDPDTLILATGSRAFYPVLPGIGLSHVCLAEDVLNETVRVERSAVIIGGGMVGLETADFLSDRSVLVTVLEMKDVLAPDEDRMTKRLLFLRLSKKGVSIYLNCGVEYITAGAVAANTVLGPKTFPAEKVVLAAGYTSVSDLVWNCDLGERETYIIGDANAKHPAGFLEAVSDGFVVGRRV